MRKIEEKKKKNERTTSVRPGRSFPYFYELHSVVLKRYLYLCGYCLPLPVCLVLSYLVLDDSSYDFLCFPCVSCFASPSFFDVKVMNIAL